MTTLLNRRTAITSGLAIAAGSALVAVPALSSPPAPQTSQERARLIHEHLKAIVDLLHAEMPSDRYDWLQICASDRFDPNRPNVPDVGLKAMGMMNVPCRSGGYATYDRDQWQLRGDGSFRFFPDDGWPYA